MFFYSTQAPRKLFYGMVNCGTEFPIPPSELTLTMANAKIQQSFRSATQNVTSVLESNEIASGNNLNNEENIAKVKDSLVCL